MKNHLFFFFLLALLFGSSLQSAEARIVNGTSCTYASSVTSWTSCINGLKYAASTTNITTTVNDPACVDVQTIVGCGGDCYSSSDPVFPAVETLGSATLSSNIYGYYTLDSTASNSGNSGYVTGYAVPPTSTISGKFAGAFSLYGNTSSYLNLGTWSETSKSDSLFQPSGQKTFSLWIKPDNKKGVIFSKYRTDISEGGYLLQIDANNRLSAGIKSTTWNTASQGPVYTTPLSQALPTTAWTHVAVTIDTSSPSKTISLFINGDYVGSNTIASAGDFTPYDPNIPFLIGAVFYGGGTNWNVGGWQETQNAVCTWPDCAYRGGIDDFFVVDKVLSDCEIKRLAKGLNACNDACTFPTCYDSTLPVTPKPLSQIFDLSTATTLKAYWPFNGNTNDAKGTNNLTNPSPWGVHAITFPVSSVSTAFSNSAEFDGAASASISNGASSIVPGNDYSVCQWYKQESNQAMQELITGRQSEWGWTGFELQTDTNNGNINVGANDNARLSKSPIPTLNQWTHVCYTKQGANTKFYINGSLVSSSTNAQLNVNPFPISLIVGQDSYSYSTSGFEYFKGYMDDISIWSKGLSECEVKSLYLGTNTCLPSCSGCYNPQDKFKATVGVAPEWGANAGVDALCKSEFGNNWQLATLDESEEAYIMTSNNNKAIFSDGVYTIGNPPTYGSPMTNQWCPSDPSPESNKATLFNISANGSSLCYSDVPKDDSYHAICRNTTITSTSTPCPSSTFSASCTATSNNGFVATTTVTWTATTTGATGPVTYAWKFSNFPDIASSTTNSSVVKEYSIPGNYFATTTVSDGTTTKTVTCLGNISGPGGGIEVDPAGGNLLTVNIYGNGSGTVSSPDGFTCSGDGTYTNTCQKSVASGTAITLSGTVGTNSTFSSWGGVCSGPTTSPCALTLNTNKTVKATFDSVITGVGNANCTSVSMISPGSSPVNINTTTTWRATSTDPNFSSALKTWTFNGVGTTTTTNNTEDKSFNTVGLKTVTVRAGSGTPCTATTTVVSSGGSVREI